MDAWLCPLIAQQHALSIEYCGLHGLPGFPDPESLAVLIASVAHEQHCSPLVVLPYGVCVDSVCVVRASEQTRTPHKVLSTSSFFHSRTQQQRILWAPPVRVSDARDAGLKGVQQKDSHGACVNDSFFSADWRSDLEP